MGIVINQSLKNTISTYFGFGIGAVNTLFLYTYFLTDAYYGLIGYLIAVANIMMPLLTFGVHNTLIKFFSSYASAKEQQRFTTMMFFLPLLTIIPAGLIGVLSYQWIVTLLSEKNELIKAYLWLTYIIAFAMAYFEVFFAWAKAHMKSVFGNFLKEVFHRIVIMGMLFMVFFEVLTPVEFIYGIAIMYLVRMLLMGIAAIRIKRPEMRFNMPQNSREILKYSGFIMLSGSIAIILLDIDKFMIGQFKAIENVAFYNVAVFTAMVIIVPARAMHQIVYPLTAKLINTKDKHALEDLYKRSALNLYIIGGLLFLLIILNIHELYKLIPASYSSGIGVVFLIALAKLSDTLLGNNNAILFNSKYYKTVLLFGVLLAVLTIILNLIFIPVWGINGAAFATLLAFLGYNSTKIGFVYARFGMHPFCRATLKTTGLLIGCWLLFYFWNFPFAPLVNMLLKSAILVILYGLVVLRLKLSEDISGLVSKYIRYF